MFQTHEKQELLASHVHDFLRSKLSKCAIYRDPPKFWEKKTTLPVDVPSHLEVSINFRVPLFMDGLEWKIPNKNG